MVSARPQFEAACQLQSLLVWPVAVQGACTCPTSWWKSSSTSSRFRWRDWPNGLGAGLWLQSREFDSLISPQLGGSYKGITHGLHP